MFFFVVTVSDLKSILSDISIATPTLFWLLFAWIYFSILLLSTYLCLWIKSESLIDMIAYRWIMFYFFSLLCQLLPFNYRVKFISIQTYFCHFAIFLYVISSPQLLYDDLKFFILFFIVVQLTYNIALVSGAQKCFSYTQIQTYTCIFSGSFPL